MTPDIKFSCPQCGQSLEAPGDMAGQIIECPACSKEIAVPGNAPDTETGGNACPGCGEEMEPDAVLCVKCGFHKGLGKKIQTHLS